MRSSFLKGIHIRSIIRRKKIGRIWLDSTAVHFDGDDSSNTVVQGVDFQNSYPLLLPPTYPREDLAFCRQNNGVS